MIGVANAPCSWGVLEFESKSASPGYAQVLDEIAASGYVGTELGDWGFMPTEPAVLRERAAPAASSRCSARLSRPASPIPARIEASLRTAVTDGAAAVGRRRRGRPGHRVVRRADRRSGTRRAPPDASMPAMGLSDGSGTTRRRGVERIARAVRDETGLRTVFHHHCAGYVETPDEIDALMQRTDPSLVGLCLDSGHATYGGGSPLDLLARHRARDRGTSTSRTAIRPSRRARAGSNGTTRRRFGTACSASWGRAASTFPELLGDCTAASYDGWIVVEQDVLPAMGSPLASATRNRDYLRRIGL